MNKINKIHVINNTCDTEENGTTTCNKANPFLHQGNPHDIIIGNPLI